MVGNFTHMAYAIFHSGSCNEYYKSGFSPEEITARALWSFANIKEIGPFRVDVLLH